MAKGHKEDDAPGDARPGPLAEGAERLAPLQRAADGLAGARLCYGRPVEAGDHVVIPVATVRARGAFGFGGGGRKKGKGGDQGDGAGGGGFVRAEPAGFIEVGPAGARYQPIDRPGGRLRGAAAVAAAAGVGVGVALAGRLTRRGRGRRASLRRSLPR